MATDLSRLRAWLNSTKLQVSSAQDFNRAALYQTIKLLINEVDTLQKAVSTGTGGATTTIINTFGGTIGPPGEAGSDGEDGSIGPQGFPGIQGTPGAGGPAGPTTIGPMGIDGTDGEDGMSIPGPQGILGSQGIQGPTGLQTIGPMGMDGQDGEDSYIQLIASGAADAASAGWVLIDEQVAAGAANYDFINLEDYSEIRVVLQGVAISLSTEVIMRVSTDNGASFLAASGDYIVISNIGVPTNAVSLRFYGAVATAARYGQIHIFGFNMTAVKVALSNIAGVTYMMQIPTTSALNAIRVLVTTGVMNSGTIFVFGR